jgi:hypothetical protein
MLMTRGKFESVIGSGMGTLIYSKEGWLSETYKYGNERELAKVLSDLSEMSCYFSEIEVAYYGYDARVLADDNDPDSEVIGTDGYPDILLKLDLDNDTFTFENV